MQKMLSGILLVLILSACSNLASGLAFPTDPEEPPPPPALPDLGQAPELRNKIWINSDKILKLKDLRGKVVLLDMWTYG